MDQQQKIAYKTRLKEVCHSIIEQRIIAAKKAVGEAQEAANMEEKSSAGDKYETSRAMGHLAKDMHSFQLASHIKELAALHAVNTGIIYTRPATGAFIRCTHVSFFIASGLGKQILDDGLLIFLSSQAPLAKSLFLKKVGDKIVFNGVESTFVEVF